MSVIRELTTERVSKEFVRAIMEPHPRLFFDVLKDVGALADVFPEIDKLIRAIENPKWHPEGNAYEHSMLVLNQAAKTDSFELRLAALVHDFGKGDTDPALMPKHHGHDVRGVPIVEKFCKRLHIPAKTTKRLMGVTRYHMNGHRLHELNPKTFVKMFDGLDAFRDPDVVVLLRDLFVCDARGRLGSENDSVDYLDFVLDVWNAVKAVKFADVFGNDVPKNGETIRNRMFQARVAAAANVCRN